MITITHKLFEGEKSVRIISKRTSEHSSFNRLKDKLGFTDDIDLVAFAASVGLYLSCVEEDFELSSITDSRKLCDMGAFEQSELFDFLIILCCDKEQERFDEFKSYFFSGLLELEEWLEKEEPDIKFRIDRFISIFENVLNIEKNAEE